MPHTFPRSRPRLAVVMALWQRPELSRLILPQYTALAQALIEEIDLILVAVGSEGPPLAQQVEAWGWQYVEFPNDPLNRKWNAGVRAALVHEPDAVMIVGSDDIVNAALFRAYVQKLRDGYDWIGLLDLYYFDATRQALGYWPGYGPHIMPLRQGEPIGCARCHSARLLKATGGLLYPDDLPGRNVALDRMSYEFLTREHDFHPAGFRLADLGAKAVDVKIEGQNITDFERLTFQFLQWDESAHAFLADLFDDPTALTALKRHWYNRRAAASLRPRLVPTP